MSNLITVSGVAGYIDENGTAHLRLEDVARGLGFTTTVSETEYVRWQRVGEYLSDFGFATSGKMPEFIPENIFYRLAMKAKNETAERFQALVADEVLPSIRKTGSYSTRPMSQAEILAGLAQLNVEMERKVTALEQKAENTEYKLSAALDALAALTPDTWKEEMNRIINGMCKENGFSYLQYRGDLYEELEKVAGCNLSSRQSRLKERMKQAGATYKERQAITKIDVIDRDPKLRAIFEGIVRRQQAKYAC